MNRDLAEGQYLLSSIERILDDNEQIISNVESHKIRSNFKDDPARQLNEVGEQIVEYYSNKTALAGAVSAIPAAVPGFGTMISIAAGTVVDLSLILKYEIEMALALSWLYGYDIRDDNERKLAFLLASVTVEKTEKGKNFYVDLIETEYSAICTYAPRQVSKLLLTSLSTKVLLRSGTVGFARMVPLVGIVITSGMNKIMTDKVGRDCREKLAVRQKGPKNLNTEKTVDAKIKSGGLTK